MWKKILTGISFMLLLTGCQASGVLEFRANGEDFVRDGFTSKDGWDIQFLNLYVTLDDVAAYQTDPPYSAEDGAAPVSDNVANLAGPITLDLAEGDETADPILVATLPDAEIGQYNAISWRMINATEGASNGATLQMVGFAEKDGERVDFTINVEQEYEYVCGEYVGDVRKGFLDDGGTADVEMTFHFDHVFGDAGSDLGEALNVGALGFGPLAAIAQDGQINADMAALSEMLTADDFATLESTLQTLGHVGEGHCYEATGGYTDKE